MDWLRKNGGLVRDWLRCQQNYWFFFNRLTKNKSGLHLGCGWNRIEPLINLDLRPTKMADLLWDCRYLDKFVGNDFRYIYANALLEHLTPKEAQELLKQSSQVLSSTGHLIITGIPDFESVSRCYLEKKPGLITKYFDLGVVSRFVYGWLGEIENATTEKAKKNYLHLHQCLYDVNRLNQWLDQTKFRSWIVFRYCYQKESLPVNLGVIAGNSMLTGKLTAGEVQLLVNGFSPDHIQKLPQKLIRH